MVKRHGALTVEAACGFSVFLGIMIIFWGLIGTMMIQNRIDEAVDQVSKELALSIFFTLELQEAITNESYQRVNDFHTAKDFFVELLDLDSIYKKSQIEDLIESRVYERIAGSRSRFEQNKALWLAAPIKVRVSWEENAMMITTYTRFAFFDMTGLVPEYGSVNSVLVPCQGAEAFFTQPIRNREVVYLTPFGISTSQKYHTHLCWSLRRAKNVIKVELGESETMPTALFKWQGQHYTLCGFCHRETSKTVSE